jgi:hypothetical protein
VRALACADRDAVRRDLTLFRVFLKRRPSYAELASQFNTTLDGVKNALYETRRRIRNEVSRLINAYTCSQTDFAEEMSAYDAASTHLAQTR